MGNEKFEKAVDEIVENIADAQEAQMALLASNIKNLYEANKSEEDSNAVAQQIMDTQIIPAKPTINLQSAMVWTAEIQAATGCTGSLDSLSYVKVGNAEPYGKEFYHHCPQHGYDLIRLHYVEEDQVHACPICRLAFK